MEDRGRLMAAPEFRQAVGDRVLQTARDSVERAAQLAPPGSSRQAKIYAMLVAEGEAILASFSLMLGDLPPGTRTYRRVLKSHNNIASDLDNYRRQLAAALAER